MSKLPVFGAERWRNFRIPCRSPYWSCWLTAVVVWTVVPSCDQLDGLATCSSAIAGRALAASNPNATAMTSRNLFIPCTPRTFARLIPPSSDRTPTPLNQAPDVVEANGDRTLIIGKVGLGFA